MSSFYQVSECVAKFLDLHLEYLCAVFIIDDRSFRLDSSRYDCLLFVKICNGFEDDILMSEKDGQTGLKICTNTGLKVSMKFAMHFANISL